MFKSEIASYVQFQHNQLQCAGRLAYLRSLRSTCDVLN